MVSLPSAAAWTWPSALKGVEERERRIRQALEDAKARDYAVEKAAAESAKKLKQQQADDNGTQALVRELAATARREAGLSVGFADDLKGAHSWFFGRTFKNFWELSGGDGQLLLSCAARAAAPDAAGSEALDRVGPTYVVKRDIVPKDKAPKCPDEPADIASFSTYHKRGALSFGSDQWDGKAAAGRLRELRKKRREARRATQVRRMFSAVRDTPALSTTAPPSQLDERHRHLARELIDAARRGRRESARAALALDRGLEADDREVRKALADYGDGDMRPPLARGARCTIRAWRDGGIDVIEREADSSDDDGGKPGTDVRFCKVENVPGVVLAVTDVVTGLTDDAVRVEPAYVVAASQVVRFYVRPIDKAALDKDSQKKKPRAAPVAIDASQKKMDEERERIKREEAVVAARRRVKDNRLKHARGARLVLDAATVQKHGSRREDLAKISGDRWGTITGLEPGVFGPASGVRARVVWDGPENPAAKTSFPIDVTAPRIIGRGATLVRAELRDFVELDSSPNRGKHGLPLTRADLLVALNAPLPGMLTTWYEKVQHLDPKSKKSRFTSILGGTDWKSQTAQRGEILIWGCVADSNPSVIVWETPAFDTRASKALALLEQLGGIVSTICKFGDRNKYEVKDPRPPPEAPTESKGLVGQALGMLGMGGSAKKGQAPGAKKKTCDDLVKLVRLVRLAPRFKDYLGRWRREREEKRVKRREAKRKARETQRTELKDKSDVAYVAARAINFVVLAKNVVEANAGAAPSAFMSGVQKSARADDDAEVETSLFSSSSTKKPLTAWLPPHRALLRADWRALACSALDRGDSALLDAISGLRVVDDPVPRADTGKTAQAADKALRDLDDALRAARLGLRGKADKASERGLLVSSKAARTVLVRLVRDAGEEVSPAKLRDQYARLVEAPAELAAASSNRRAQIEAGKLSAQHLILAEAACECADAAARALPRLFEELCRAALDATNEQRRRDVLERVLLENDGRIARAVVAAGSSDWLYSVLKTEGGALEAFPFGLWHVAVMGCRVAPDAREVRMQQRALFEDRPAWERALEMRVRARAKLVPDRVKGVLANVATRARLAALGKRAGAGARMQRDPLGRTGLAVAVALGRPRDVIMACCDDSREADARDNLGWLPQHHAAVRADTVALDIVLDAATRGVDFPTPSGHTALHLVAASRAPLASRLACAALLLRRGAAASRRTASGLAALDLLVHAPVAKWTGTTRAAAAAAAEETMHFVATAAATGVPSTVAQCLAIAGNAGAIRALGCVKTPLAADLGLEREFDAADAGISALHVAQSADVVKALVEKGGDVSALTVRERECALHYAARSDAVNVVVALLEAGAKAGPRFANAHGESPRDVAVPGSKARKAMDERIAALRAERGRRAVGVHTEDWSQALLALDRAGKVAALRKDVASAKVRQTLTSAAAPEAAGGGAAASKTAPEAALTAFLDASTPVKLVGPAFTSFFQLTPADRAITLGVLKDVAQNFKKAPHTRVFLAPSRAGGKACYLTGAVVWQATEDVVDGLASTVVRVFAVDGGGADPVKFQQSLAQLFARAAKSPLKHSVMPDPDSETGVAKWYRLTSRLAAVEAFRGTAGQPFELDGPEQEAVAGFFEDPRPLLLNGRGGSGKTLIAYRVIIEGYNRARKAGQRPPRSVVVTGSARLRDAFAAQFDAWLRVTYPLEAASRSKGDIGALPPGPAFYTTDQLVDALNATLADPFRRTAVVNRGVVETTLVGKPWLDAYEAKAGACGPADLSEIFSVVKGSSDALHKGRPLTLAEYEALPRRASSYHGDARRAFYARYERYEKALKGATHHDSLDVVLHVASRLAKKPLYDSLLVDEVQDFPEAKIGLLLRLTSNPSAVLFGGDTAQTIARTRFRFGQLADFLRRRVGVEPRNVELAVNYRSTQEVLDVSNVFVAALASQFENHVDRLPREVARRVEISHAIEQTSRRRGA